jgi:hypothetical protein
MIRQIETNQATNQKSEKDNDTTINNHQSSEDKRKTDLLHTSCMKQVHLCKEPMTNGMTTTARSSKQKKLFAARNGITDLPQPHDGDDGNENENENEANNTTDCDRTFVILEELEKQERIKYYPHLITRKQIPVDNHGTMIVPSAMTTMNDTIDVANKCDLSEHHLRGEFTLERISIIGELLYPSSLSNIINLNLSRNELWGLPSSKAMESLTNLETLDISRNWFEELPLSIGVLEKLKSLNASHNILHSSQQSLLLLPAATVPLPDNNNNNNNNDDDSSGSGGNNDDDDGTEDPHDTVAGDDNSNYNRNNSNTNFSILRSLKYLKELNLEFNSKCNHQKLKDKIENELYNKIECKLKMTINLPPKPREEGFFVGESPAVRDPTLLRSQLECWSTTKLRRRLVADFGQEPLPENCGRSVVMDQLLTLYAKEKISDDTTSYDDEDSSRDEVVVNPQRQRGMRKIIRTSGILIKDESLLDNLLLALTEWKNGWTNKNNERTAIDAENYMILTSPASWENLGRNNHQKAEAKLNANIAIWKLAKQVVESVDEEFAEKYTALAVTHNFIGSPHIDRQNIGPFYGLSLGDFDDGTGGIMVECTARIVAHNNTKNRVAKCDGRFPHWVAPYDNESKQRFSLIFYQTMGASQPLGTSVFNLSDDDDFSCE